MDKTFGKILFILIASASLMLIPALAMQFSDEVQWNVGDFLMAWFLISALGLSIYFVNLKFKNRRLKQAIWFFLFLLFALVWAQLAVRLF